MAGIQKKIQVNDRSKVKVNDKCLNFYSLFLKGGKKRLIMGNGRRGSRKKKKKLPIRFYDKK